MFPQAEPKLSPTGVRLLGAKVAYARLGAAGIIAYDNLLARRWTHTHTHTITHQDLTYV